MLVNLFQGFLYSYNPLLPFDTSNWIWAPEKSGEMFGSLSGKCTEIKSRIDEGEEKSLEEKNTD